MKLFLTLTALVVSCLVFARQPEYVLVVNPQQVTTEATTYPGNFLNGRNNVTIYVDGKEVAKTCKGKIKFVLSECQQRLMAVVENATRQGKLIAIDPNETDYLPAITNLRIDDLK